MSLIKKKLDKARTIVMFTNAFFGQILMKTSIIQKGKINCDCWTNGRDIFYTSEHLEKVPIKKLTSELLHLLLHIVLHHVTRCGNRNREVWNLACDIAVNVYVDEIKQKYNDFYDTLFSFEIYKYKDKTVEEIYNKLIENIESDGGDINIQIPVHMQGDITQEALEDVEAYINAMVNQSMMMSNTYGSTALGVYREINNLLAPKISWKNYLKELIEPYLSDWSFTEKDRRYIGSPFFIPSLSGDKVYVYVAIDTSGSITDDELNTFISECVGILNSYERVEIKIIVCDAVIQDVFNVSNVPTLEKCNMNGGGGTNFIPVFDYVQKDNATNNKFLVYFTDGMGSYPDPSIYNIKTLWVLTQTYDVPFGKSILY